jgi:predicted nucleic acid-binding protein
VKRWLEITERESQHVSIITLAEIQKGIELLAGVNRRAQFEQLVQDLEAWFFGRIILVDRRVAVRWASLVAQGSRTGRSLAATALAYDLTIVTRNTKDFEGRSDHPQSLGFRVENQSRGDSAEPRGVSVDGEEIVRFKLGIIGQDLFLGRAA